MEATLASEDVQRLRAVVRQRLSARNRCALVAMVLGAPIPLIDASHGPFHGWTLLVALLSPAVGALLWQLNPWRRERVRCPICGEDWEYDEFLSWRYCEECGVSLPSESAT